MNNKKGFISVSIIYSFFIVFLLIMLAMLASYSNKRFFVTNPPTDFECDANDNLKVCDCKKAAALGLNYTEDPDCPGGQPSSTNNDDELCTPTGLYTAEDDYGKSDYFAGNYERNYVYYGGYIWRKVRYNGDGKTLRLIYAGESENKKLKANSKPYIQVKNFYQTGETIEQTRYNFSFVANSLCSSAYNTYINTKPSTCDSDMSCNSTLQKFSEWAKGVINNTSKVNVMKRCLVDGKDTGTTSTKNTNSVRGAVEFHNIGYMRNTVYTPRYDSIFDNQDDSELKGYVDYWYNNNLVPNIPSGTNTRPVGDVIFCGDKNLETSIGDNISYHFDSFVSFLKSPKTYQKPSNDFYYSGYARIDGNQVPSLVCMPSGDLGNSKALSSFAGLDADYFLETKVLNFSKYTTGGTSLLYQRNQDDVNITWRYSKCPKITCSNNKTPYWLFGWKCPSNGKVSKTYIDCLPKIPEITSNSSTEFYKTSGTGMRNKVVSRISNPNSNWLIDYAIKLDGYDKTLGNGQLSYPIGLLSVDEAYFAGARKEEGTVCPSAIDSNILNNNGQNQVEYWTMSLHSTNMAWGNDYGAKYYTVKTSSEGSQITAKNDTIKQSDGAYIRPVINVSIDIPACTSRKGTADDPIILGESC